MQGNLYEQRSASIAEQLCGPHMVMDYDQLLAKPPQKPGAVFHWHQVGTMSHISPPGRHSLKLVFDERLWAGPRVTSVAGGGRYYLSVCLCVTVQNIASQGYMGPVSANQ